MIRYLDVGQGTVHRGCRAGRLARIRQHPPTAKYFLNEFYEYAAKLTSAKDLASETYRLIGGLNEFRIAGIDLTVPDGEDPETQVSETLEMPIRIVSNE